MKLNYTLEYKDEQRELLLESIRGRISRAYYKDFAYGLSTREKEEDINHLMMYVHEGIFTICSEQTIKENDNKK